MTDDLPRAPARRAYPALKRWLDERGMTFEDGAQLFGCTRQFLSDVCRAFDDEKRKRPGPKLLTRIVRVTEGAVRPSDFSPPVDDILRGMAA
jgi:hypothetical protein